MFRVYLIDDEKWLLDSLQEMIEWNKYNAVVIGKQTSSVKALDEIRILCPDIIFTDIRMPDIDGIELMQRIKLWKKNIEFIFITGYAEFEYAKKAIQLNAVEYCLKPVEEETLIKALLKAEKSCEKQKVLNALEDKATNSENFDSDKYSLVLEYIQENFKEQLTLNEIAETFHYNPTYLSMLLKKELGKNFISYLNELKITYACELLGKTNLSINDIANMCGFSNYFYFAKIFKKIRGITPSQYRTDK